MSMAGSLRSVGEADNVTMSHAVRKSRRSKAKKTSSSSRPHVTPASDDCQHPYLAERQMTAIQKWNETVPKKHTKTNLKPEQQDPAIQAYLEAKLALFRNAELAKGSDAHSVSSTQS
jgi:hypothetical protein